VPDFRFGGAYPDSSKYAPLNVRRSEKEFRPSRTRVRNVTLLHVEDGSIFEAGRPWSGGDDRRPSRGRRDGTERLGWARVPPIRVLHAGRVLILTRLCARTPWPTQILAPSVLSVRGAVPAVSTFEDAGSSFDSGAPLDCSS